MSQVSCVIEKNIYTNNLTSLKLFVVNFLVKLQKIVRIKDRSTILFYLIEFVFITNSIVVQSYPFISNCRIKLRIPTVRF